MTSSDALRFARTEAARCRRAVAAGGSPCWWRDRLATAINNLEAAALILRMQASRLDEEAKEGA